VPSNAAIAVVTPSWPMTAVAIRSQSLQRLHLDTFVASTHSVQGGRVFRHFVKPLSAVAVLATTVALGASAGMAATQGARNSADSGAANAALTSQSGNQQQNAGSSSGSGGCVKLCTGGGGNITLQDASLDQAALTKQEAASAAEAKQTAVNANVPVTIVGSGVAVAPSGGANQKLDNSASSTAANASATKQSGNQQQNAGSSSGSGGCAKECTGGGGNITNQYADLGQEAATLQAAESLAAAKQNAVNANVPVTIVGFGKAIDPPSGANQFADNSASSTAANASATKQSGNQQQNAGTSSGASGGGTGGGGNIADQAAQMLQGAKTAQGSASAALAAQLLSNASTGVNIG
jgi:hypothetical protein